MHTFEGKEHKFHYNPDMSGDVIVNCPDVDGNSVVVAINGEDILDFVAHYIVEREVSKFAHMTTDEVFDYAFKKSTYYR